MEIFGGFARVSVTWLGLPLRYEQALPESALADAEAHLRLAVLRPKGRLMEERRTPGPAGVARSSINASNRNGRDMPSGSPQKAESRLRRAALGDQSTCRAMCPRIWAGRCWPVPHCVLFVTVGGLVCNQGSPEGKGTVGTIQRLLGKSRLEKE